MWHTLVTGSVARRVLRHATCPVLVVPTPEMTRTTSRLPRRARHGKDPVWEQCDRQAPRSPPDQPV